MKITLTQVVEVDPEKWAREFGIEKKKVRQDVKGYFDSWCQEHVDSLRLGPDPDPTENT